MTLSSKNMRKNPLFMRNNFEVQGRWGLPLIHKQTIDTTDISLIACSETRFNDSESRRKCGVHFFVDDYRFNATYNTPERSIAKYSQYAFLLSPDFSTYADMDIWRQIESVAKNRWVGAYWQSKGLTVIPTMSWSTPSSYDFCFDGVEENSIIAVGMIGCKRSKSNFLQGYNAMLEKLSPEKIICFGKPFPEMKGNLVVVNYPDFRKKVC